MRVIVADDEVLLREGLARLLTEAGFEVAGKAGDAVELLRLVELRRPDLAVVDIKMPPTHTDEGLAAARQIGERHPSVGVLVLSHYLEPRYAMRLLEDHPETREGEGTRPARCRRRRRMRLSRHRRWRRRRYGRRRRARRWSCGRRTARSPACARQPGAPPRGSARDRRSIRHKAAPHRSRAVRRARRDSPRRRDAWHCRPTRPRRAAGRAHWPCRSPPRPAPRTGR